MERRKFLQLLSTGVAASVAASVGFFDLGHFLSWLRRQPRWSFPSGEYQEFVQLSGIAEATAATELLPELNIGPLMTIYYDRQALMNLEQNIRLDNLALQISPPRSFPGGTKAIKFGNIWKPVLETKQGLVVV